ncbi:hypothetical protein AGDE_13007 [Angomonas deanei]|uniref:Uncharacterized protein n=1 Tax=Angomonas deanei TaxID=59799 RepID=A0A7G2C9R0_9TRYP|nr:hypothetical protein AGDE_13007 [Angomonas deanei]CAD2216590.1 hypothetical protein, conserved [Angomonas deanei]|eukprot:EPY23166.1 hypothetical protein AGDE_13007 [Angomonas deanei]
MQTKRHEASTVGEKHVSFIPPSPEAGSPASSDKYKYVIPLWHTLTPERSKEVHADKEINIGDIIAYGEFYTSKTATTHTVTTDTSKWKWGLGTVLQLVYKRESHRQGSQAVPSEITVREWIYTKTQSKNKEAEGKRFTTKVSTKTLEYHAVFGILKEKESYLTAKDSEVLYLPTPPIVELSRLSDIHKSFAVQYKKYNELLAMQERLKLRSASQDRRRSRSTSPVPGQEKSASPSEPISSQPSPVNNEVDQTVRAVQQYNNNLFYLSAAVLDVHYTEQLYRQQITQSQAEEIYALHTLYTQATNGPATLSAKQEAEQQLALLEVQEAHERQLLANTQLTSFLYTILPYYVYEIKEEEHNENLLLLNHKYLTEIEKYRFHLRERQNSHLKCVNYLSNQLSENEINRTEFMRKRYYNSKKGTEADTEEEEKYNETLLLTLTQAVEKTLDALAADGCESGEEALLGQDLLQHKMPSDLKYDLRNKFAEFCHHAEQGAAGESPYPRDPLFRDDHRETGSVLLVEEELFVQEERSVSKKSLSCSPGYDDMHDSGMEPEPRKVESPDRTDVNELQKLLAAERAKSEELQRRLDERDTTAKVLQNGNVPDDVKETYRQAVETKKSFHQQTEKDLERLNQDILSIEKEAKSIHDALANQSDMSELEKTLLEKRIIILSKQNFVMTTERENKKNQLENMNSLMSSIEVILGSQ